MKLDRSPNVPGANASAQGSVMSLKLCCAMAVTSPGHCHPATGLRYPSLHVHCGQFHAPSIGLPPSLQTPYCPYEAPWKEPLKLDRRPEAPGADANAEGRVISLKLCCAMAVTSAALSPSSVPNTPNLWLWLLNLLCSACAAQ